MNNNKLINEIGSWVKQGHPRIWKRIEGSTVWRLVDEFIINKNINEYHYIVDDEYAEVRKAFNLGRTIQWYDENSNAWFDWKHDYEPNFIMYPGSENYRVKPKFTDDRSSLIEDCNTSNGIFISSDFTLGFLKEGLEPPFILVKEKFKTLEDFLQWLVDKYGESILEKDIFIDNIYDIVEDKNDFESCETVGIHYRVMEAPELYIPMRGVYVSEGNVKLGKIS